MTAATSGVGGVGGGEGARESWPPTRHNRDGAGGREWAGSQARDACGCARLHTVVAATVPPQLPASSLSLPPPPQAPSRASSQARWWWVSSLLASPPPPRPTVKAAAQTPAATAAPPTGPAVLTVCPHPTSGFHRRLTLPPCSASYGQRPAAANLFSCGGRHHQHPQMASPPPPPSPSPSSPPAPLPPASYALPVSPPLLKPAILLAIVAYRRASPTPWPPSPAMPPSATHHVSL